MTRRNPLSGEGAEDGFPSFKILAAVFCETAQDFFLADSVEPDDEIDAGWPEAVSCEGIVVRTTVRSTEIRTFDPRHHRRAESGAHPRDPGPPDARRLVARLRRQRLLFELRAFVRDVNNRLAVTSELRFAIFAAFRKAGIQIRFPQCDLHVIKDVDVESSTETAPSRAASKVERGRGTVRLTGHQGTHRRGARMLPLELQREGLSVNHKRMHRVYRELIVAVS